MPVLHYLSFVSILSWPTSSFKRAELFDCPKEGKVTALVSLGEQPSQDLYRVEVWCPNFQVLIFEVTRGQLQLKPNTQKYSE